ncbi:hypothetical protein BJ138DRAFT_1103345 [Hygrophoropsis aurantiaca]|uniref:Uncharacterized protein n=1 Tax=Hygrophoropsis aurantiaca TaxID=72124 RepID=A0ACB8A5N9_9AGAM|nr:hypothetical protein BJ138DRAFT_1103345 [Hygrophoropsis aurantiaca]
MSEFQPGDMFAGPAGSSVQRYAGYSNRGANRDEGQDAANAGSLWPYDPSNTTTDFNGGMQNPGEAGPPAWQPELQMFTGGNLYELQEGKELQQLATGLLLPFDEVPGRRFMPLSTTFSSMGAGSTGSWCETGPNSSITGVSEWGAAGLDNDTDRASEWGASTGLDNGADGTSEWGATGLDNGTDGASEWGATGPDNGTAGASELAATGTNYPCNLDTGTKNEGLTAHPWALVSQAGKPAAWTFSLSLPAHLSQNGVIIDNFASYGSKDLNDVLLPAPYFGEYITPGEPIQDPSAYGPPTWEAYLGLRLKDDFWITLLERRPKGTFHFSEWQDDLQMTRDSKRGAERLLAMTILNSGTVFLRQADGRELAKAALKRTLSNFGVVLTNGDQLDRTASNLYTSASGFVKAATKAVFEAAPWDFGIMQPDDCATSAGATHGFGLIANKMAYPDRTHYWCHRKVKTAKGPVEARYVDMRIDLTIVKLLLSMSDAAILWFTLNPLPAAAEDFAIPYKLIGYTINYLEWGCGRISLDFDAHYYADNWVSRLPVPKPKGGAEGKPKKRIKLSHADSERTPETESETLIRDLEAAFCHPDWKAMHQARFYRLFVRIQLNEQLIPAVKDQRHQQRSNENELLPTIVQCKPGTTPRHSNREEKTHLKKMLSKYAQKTTKSGLSLFWFGCFQPISTKQYIESQ